MDTGPLNYDTWGIIKHRICVENVPGVELLGLIKYDCFPTKPLIVYLCLIGH